MDSMASKTLVFLGLVALTSGQIAILAFPEQIHLSFGASASEVVVTWVTQNFTDDAWVQWGVGDMTSSARGVSSKFVDQGKLQRVFFIHSATMGPLKDGLTYKYRCGGAAGWSHVMQYRAVPDHANWSPRLLVLGDMGVENARALPWLQKEVNAGGWDALLHVGDIAYNLDDDNGMVGDKYMKSIEPIASRLPYMTCVGNHESAYNFSHYRSRFRMPGGDGTNMWFSWDLGPAHLISFSTEVYYYDLSATTLAAMYQWLDNDLTKANAQRDVRPWIIVAGHKPMYCSNSDHGGLCESLVNPIRYGIPAFPPSLEELFYRHGVDLQFYGHQHSYERLLPVYNLKVCNGSRDAPYTNPPAPVHIVTGSAGSKEGTTSFLPVVFPWSGFHSDDYGYTRMTISNASHLYMEQVSVDKEGEVIDSMWLVKDRHGPNTFNC